MSVPPSIPSPGSPADWLRHAASNLQYANLGCADPDVLRNQVGFHAQQAVEKSLKAVLLNRQVNFTRTHDLNALIQLLKHAGISWPSQLEDAKNLTPFAVQTRYSGYIAQLSEKEIQEAIQLAEDVLAWASAELGFKVN